MTGSSRFSPRSDVVLTEMNDGTGVLLNMSTKFYYTLNKTGVFLWRQLEQGAADRGDLVTRLHQRYAVDTDRAGSDVDAVLKELLSEELIEARG